MLRLRVCCLSLLALAVLAAGMRTTVAMAQPQGTDPMLDQCLCKESLSRVLCKPTTEFNYIGSRGEVYYFNVFYGSKHENFMCRVIPANSVSGTVIINSKAWLRLRRSLTYSYNATARKVDGDTYNPECPRPPFQCSRSATPEELENAREDAFWYRPIPPELLGVDEFGGDDGQDQSDDMSLPEGLRTPQ